MITEHPSDEYDYYCTDCRGTISPKDRVCPHCGSDTSEFIEEQEPQRGVKIETLFSEFYGLTTTHQREERLKTFIGRHVEIANCVQDILSDRISLLKRYGSDLSTYEGPAYWDIPILT